MAAEWSFRREGDVILATEKWFLDDPALPFIVPPWHPYKDAIQRALDGAVFVATDYPFTEPRFVDIFGAEKLPPHTGGLCD